MKKANLYLLLAAMQMLTGYLYAQNNRSADKKSVPYRANYQRVSSGGIAFHTLEIRNGILWAWGSNESGQLGNGTTIEEYSPVQIGTDNKWVAVATAYAHSVGLKSDGTLWGWGYGEWSGVPTNGGVPTQIGTGNSWVSITAGDSHTLALKSDGTLWAWGWNSAGELGIGNNGDVGTPVQVGTDNNWVTISAFHEHSFGVKSDGTLWAWGLNESGQLGDGTLINRNIPVQIGNDHDWITVTGASIGLKANGTLWTWGLLNGSNIPVQTGTDNKWVSIAGGGLSLGLKSDGTLWSLSGNNSVQIGTGNDWVSISANYGHSFAVKSDGTLWGWGANDLGQLGNGTDIGEVQPVQLGATLNILLSISAGQEHSIQLRSNGTLWSWGYNFYGQLGIGNNLNKNVPVQIGTDQHWISVAAAAYVSLGIKSNGTLWAWGNNDYGQLGIGNTVNQNSPVQVGTDNTWVSVTVGDSHCMGLKSDGSLWAWGRNSQAQLGDGTFADKNSPVQIGTSHDWVSMAAGGSHSLAIQSDGSLWAWGWNVVGQLGDGTSTQRTSPVQIGTGHTWVSVSAGDLFSLGRQSDGTAWAWGSNQYGQTGNGTNNFPVQTGSGNAWIHIERGLFHTHGIQPDGTLWAWGRNNEGQLGDGTNTDKPAPVKIGTDQTWVAVSGGLYHTLGLKAGRTAFCATGNNTSGQLGNQTNISQNIFTCASILACDPPPSPAAGPVTPVCSGQTALLTATGVGTLGWYSAATGGLWLGGGNAFTTPPLTGTSTFYVQDSTCAASDFRIPVTVTLQSSLPPPPPYSPYDVICNGETARLSAYGTNEGTISWYDAPTGGNWLGSGMHFTTPVLYYNGPATTYSFYVQDSICVASTTRFLTIVEVYPSFIPTFDPVPPVCYGSVAPVLPTTSTNFVNGSWSPATVSNTTSAIYTFTPDGHYLECSVPVSLEVTVLPLTIPLFDPVPDICSGTGSPVLPATSTNAINGSWSPATVSNTVSATYTFTPDAGQCASGTSLYVTVTTEIMPQFDPAPQICRGVGSYTLPAITNNGISGTWLPATVSNLASATYTFTPDQGQCGLITTLFITVSDIVTPLFTPVSPICSGTGSPVLPATSANGITGTWSPATVSNTISGTYTFTPDAGQCATAATMEINILPAPAASIINLTGSTSLNCAITSIDITATGGVSYAWSNGLGNQASVTITSPGNYTVTVTGANGCTAQVTVVIDGNTSVPVPVVSGPSNVCPYIGTAVQLMFTVPVQTVPTTYSWIVPSTVNIVSGQGNDTLIVTIGAGFIANANKQLRVRSTSVCGTSDLYIHYLKASFPGTPAIISGPVEICPYLASSATALYEISPVTAAVSYQWTVPAGALITENNGTSIRVSFNNSFTSGLIAVRAVNNCGTGSERKLAIAKTVPATPGLINGPNQLCTYMPTPDHPSGIPVQYKIAKVNNASSYQWTVPAGGTITGHTDNGTEDIITVSFNSQFLFGYVTVTAANYCGLSAVRSLYIGRLNPSAPGPIDGPTDACGYMEPGGFIAGFSVLPVPHTSYYVWDIPQGATAVTGQGTNAISFRFPSGYNGGQISVTAFNGCGSSATRKKTITRHDPGIPGTINVTENQACPGRVYLYYAAAPAYTPVLTWTVPAGAVILSGQGSEMIMVSYPPTAISGQVTVTGSNSCGSSAARELNVNLPACPPGLSRTNGAMQPNIIMAVPVGSGDEFSTHVYPNPTTFDFRLMVRSPDKHSRLTLRVLDLQGRMLKKISAMPYQTISFGSELKAGYYLVEVKQGSSVKTTKLIKF